MALHFRAGWQAREEGRKVAWVTSGAPVELLHALDVTPVYPENHGAVCGVARAGGALCRVAEEHGYRNELCSYMRIDWGARYDPPASPIGGLPPPDFLVCADNICRTVLKWFEGISRFYRAPLVLLDMPFRHGDEEPQARRYVREQFRRLPAALSRLAGNSWNEERFRTAVSLSREASVLWESCLDAHAARPAPASAIDQFIMMGPIVTLRGTSEAVAFYRELREEIGRRVARGEGAVEGERIRLFWDNLPVWHRLRFLSELLAAHGAVLVGATYTNAWTARPSAEEDPLDALADAYAGIWLNRGFSYREEVIAGLSARLGADGVVFHSNRSCKPYSFGQAEIAARIKARGIPCLILDGDMADERDFAEAGWRTRIEAFLERLQRT